MENKIIKIICYLIRRVLIMTYEKIEEIVMELVGYAGEVRSYAFEALRMARKGKFEKVEAYLKKSNQALLEAHHIQTQFIQDEINEQKVPYSLLMIHAQDHLMTAILAKELIEELIIDKKEKTQ